MNENEISNPVSPRVGVLSEPKLVDEGLVKVALEAGVERKTGVVALENSDGGIVAAAIVTENFAHAKIEVRADGVAASEDLLVHEKTVGLVVPTEDGIVCAVSTVAESESRQQITVECPGSSASLARLRKRVIPGLYSNNWDVQSPPRASREQDTCCRGLPRRIFNNITGDLKNLRDKCCKPSDRWTTNLKKARNHAWKMLGSIVFPLFNWNVVRDVWVAIEFILALVGLGLSIATLSLDHNAIFNILHLALAITSFTLSLLDLVFNRRCKSCKCFSEQKRSAEYDISTGKCCKKCFSGTKKIIDVLRALVAEVLIYPLLMCNLLGVITGRGYTGESGSGLLSFILFVLSCFSLILYVYAIRILVMVKAITGRRQIGRPKQEWLNELGDQYNPSLGRSSIYYQIWFFMNMVFLMIIQVLMVIAIGMKMYSDNLHFYKKDNKDEEIRVTPALWYMMACGYVAPFLGFLSYLMITMPWAQDFFLGMFYDIVSLCKFWKKGGVDDLLPGGKKEEEEDDTEEPEITSEMISRLTRYFELFKNDLEEYRKMKFCNKVTYPFTTFIVFPFCVLYTWMQVFFTGFAGITVFDLLEDSSVWAVLYLASVPLAGLFSTHIFVIGFMWSMVLYAVTVGVAFVIAFSPFIILYYISRALK